MAPMASRAHPPAVVAYLPAASRGISSLGTTSTALVGCTAESAPAIVIAWPNITFPPAGRPCVPFGSSTAALPAVASAEPRERDTVFSCPDDAEWKAVRAPEPWRLVRNAGCAREEAR